MPPFSQNHQKFSLLRSHTPTAAQPNRLINGRGVPADISIRRMGQLVRRVRYVRTDCACRAAVQAACGSDCGRCRKSSAWDERRRPYPLRGCSSSLQRQPSGDALITALTKSSPLSANSSTALLPVSCRQFHRSGGARRQSMCSPAVSQASICAAASEMMSPGR